MVNGCVPPNVWSRRRDKPPSLRRTESCPRASGFEDWVQEAAATLLVDHELDMAHPGAE